VTLYCATTNPGKLREFNLGASRFGHRVLPLPRPVSPCPETGSTFEQNAIQKALHYGPHAPDWLFADDSGLEVEALGGGPGVFSARYAGTGASDRDNNRLLLERLRGVQNRAARFVCAIALVDGTTLLQTFRETADGEITETLRGDEGFGYDPLFLYRPLGQTFAEIPADQKMQVSHRGKAIARMFRYLAAR